MAAALCQPGAFVPANPRLLCQPAALCQPVPGVLRLPAAFGQLCSCFVSQRLLCQPAAFVPASGFVPTSFFAAFVPTSGFRANQSRCANQLLSCVPALVVLVALVLIVAVRRSSRTSSSSSSSHGMTLAPRIVTDVSNVMRINHEIRFAWQAQYLVTLEDDSCCSAHCK